MSGTAAGSIELATAYVSINARTDNLSKQIKSAFSDAGRYGDEAGRQAAANMGSRLKDDLSSKQWVKRALDDAAKGSGQTSAAGFFQEFRTTSERLGAAAGLVIGKTVGGGIHAGIAAVDVNRALTAKLQSSGLTTMATNAGKSIGRATAMAVHTSIASVGVGGVLSAGAVLTGGFDRLKNIDAAEFKLKALGHTGSEVKDIMASALTAVKGTSFALDDAATASASAVAAGVKPGQDLTAYLTNISDAAAIAGTGFGEMGAIFNKVTTGGKAFTDDLDMLAGRGIPIFKWLQKEYGVTGEALSDMVQSGQVDAAHFQKVIADNIGGAAKNMGGSFDGAAKKLKAGLDRIGANFLEPLLGNSESEIGGVTSVMGSLTGKLVDLEVWAGTHQGSIRRFFSTTAELVLGAASGITTSIGGIVKGIGQLVGGVGNALGTLLKGRAAISDFFGQHDDADKARSAAEVAFGWGESMQKAGDGLIGFGQSMMGATDKVHAWGQAGKNAADQLTAAIGGAVVSVNGKDIALKTNTPDVAKKLDELGIKVQNLPDGEVKLVPNTPEAQSTIDEWLAKNNPTGQPVTTAVEIDTASADQKLQSFIGKWSQYLFGGTVDPVVKNPLTAPYQSGSVQNPLTAPFEPGTGSYDGAGSARSAAEPPQRLPAGGGGQGYMNFDEVSAYLDNVSATRDMNMTGLKPMAAALKRATYAMFPQIKDIGGYRASDPYPDHPSGNALDIMIPDAATGNAVNNYVRKNAAAFGLQYDLWQQKTWRPDGSVSGMEDRGSPTQNHMDHVHAMTGGPATGMPAFPWDVGFRLLPSAGKVYDTGGWLPHGTTTVTNATGKPELILNPEQQQRLADSGIDPNGLLHGLEPAKSLPGSPATDMLKQLGKPIEDPANPDAGQQPNYGMDFVRSMGFIPASAGSTGVAGTSSLAGFINMGNSVVGGAIDTGVNLANTAISAAMAAGTFGAGAAASPLAGMAAGYGTQMVGNELKRISSYWFGLAGIGADALQEQLSPFGAPRWLGYDYAKFAPQLGIQQAATSTIEKMGNDAISKAFPQTSSQPAMDSLPGAAPAPTASAALDLNPTGPAPGKTPPSPLQELGIYDTGGWLQPGGVGINLSKRPEPILTGRQWDSMKAAASNPPSNNRPLVENLYTQDMQDAIRQLDKVKRRDMMQYAGRG